MSLQNTNKFFLIDETNIHQLTNSLTPNNNKSSDNASNHQKPIHQLTNVIRTNNRLEPILNREVKQLDSSMLHILDDDSLTTDEKVNKYNQLLLEFQSINGNKLKPVQRYNKKDNSEEQKTEEYDYLIGIPKQQNKKAKDLMSILNKSDNFKVSNTGSIEIDGVSIPKSNINDLLNKAVNPRITYANVPGWENFKSLLTEENVPKSLLANKHSEPDHSFQTPPPISQPRKRQSPSIDHDYLNRWLPHDLVDNGKKKKNKSQTTHK